MTQLSELEKMALAYCFMEGITASQQMYGLCHNREEYTPNKQVWRNLSSQWKKSEPVQAYLASLKARFDTRVDSAVQAALKNAKADPTYVPSASIDFTNLDQFLAEANRLANNLDDEKDKQFYLKTIADLMRFKEGSQDKNQDIQRFYTPLLCRDCPLHKEAEEKLVKGKKKAGGPAE